MEIDESIETSAPYLMLFTINTTFRFFWTGEAVMDIDLRHDVAEPRNTASHESYAQDARLPPSLAIYLVRPARLSDHTEDTNWGSGGFTPVVWS